MGPHGHARDAWARDGPRSPFSPLYCAPTDPLVFVFLFVCFSCLLQPLSTPAEARTAVETAPDRVLLVAAEADIPAVRRLLGNDAKQRVYAVEMVLGAFLSQELALDDPTTQLNWQLPQKAS